jgi:MFS family permease
MNAMDADHATLLARHHAEMRRYFWRNYLAHSLDGGLYVGGMAFLAAESVLPPMIRMLGGPNWLVSLMPTMMMGGFALAPLLAAHRVERLQVVKPFVVFMGVFQRLPVLLAGLALLLWAHEYPYLVLVVATGAPFVTGLAGGFGFSAWIELISRTIPEDKRASTWSVRYVLAALIGIIAGIVVKGVLAHYPGPEGYAILHFIAFGFMCGSLLAFLGVRETSKPPTQPRPPASLKQNLRSIPSLFMADDRLRSFALMRMLGAGVLIMLPFLSLHALDVTGRSSDYVGYFVAAQMSGSICGNLLAGFLGDRFGGKMPLGLGRALIACACLGAAVNTSTWGFIALFFLLGMAFSMNNISSSILMIEISPAERRPTYVSVMSLLMFPTMLVAAGVSTLIRDVLHAFWPAAVVSALMMGASLLFLARIEEPRRRARAAVPDDVLERAE